MCFCVSAEGTADNYDTSELLLRDMLNYDQRWNTICNFLLQFQTWLQHIMLRYDYSYCIPRYKKFQTEKLQFGRCF